MGKVSIEDLSVWPEEPLEALRNYREDEIKRRSGLSASIKLEFLNNKEHEVYVYAKNIMPEKFELSNNWAETKLTFTKQVEQIKIELASFIVSNFKQSDIPHFLTKHQ